MYIYKIYHESSDKVYIGKTNDLRKRLSGHLQDAKKSKSHIHRWLMKLRRSGFYPKIESIEKVYESNWEQRERHWIKFYRNKLGKDKVLNIRDGGEDPPQGHRLGKTISEESRKRMSLAQKKRFKREESPRKGIKLSDEERKKLSNAHLGQKAWNTGVKYKGKRLIEFREKKTKFKNQKDINTIYELFWVECKSLNYISNLYHSHTFTIGKIVREIGGFKYTGNLKSKRVHIHGAMKL